MSRDAGSIPAASTHAGFQTRLKPNKARQSKPPGLALLVHLSRVLGVVTKCEENVQRNYFTDQEQPLLHEPWSFSGLQKVNRRTILI